MRTVRQGDHRRQSRVFVALPSNRRGTMNGTPLYRHRSLAGRDVEGRCRKGGFLVGNQYTHLSLEERFWAKVNKTDDCWLWTATTAHGYGNFRFDGKMVRAHRFAYTLLVGPIPAGLEIDHLCRIRACVNPFHLEPVTHRENGLRGDGVAGRRHRQTHCLRGHIFDETNTYRTPTRPATRTCLTCQKMYKTLVPTTRAGRADYYEHRTGMTT